MKYRLITKRSNLAKLFLQVYLLNKCVSQTKFEESDRFKVGYNNVGQGIQEWTK